MQLVVNHLTVEAEIEAATTAVRTSGISQPCLLPIDCDTENWSLDLLTKAFVNRDRWIHASDLIRLGGYYQFLATCIATPP